MAEKRTRIYRNTNKNNYSIINNEVLRRVDMSWKAKGLMCYILMLPDNWEIYLEELMNNATDKKASFRSGWDELKEKGYVKRYPIREGGKIVEWRTEIFETVDLTAFSPHTDFQEVENLEVENLEVENRKLLSTYITNDLAIQNTDNTKKDMTPPKKTSPSKPTRHKYGEYKNVLLSDTEMEKLKNEFPNDWQQRIEKVSEYVAANGAKYKNFLAVIRKWAKNESNKPKAGFKNSYGNQSNRKETLPEWAKEKAPKKKEFDEEAEIARLKKLGVL